MPAKTLPRQNPVVNLYLQCRCQCNYLLGTPRTGCSGAAGSSPLPRHSAFMDLDPPEPSLDAGTTLLPGPDALLPRPVWSRRGGSTTASHSSFTGAENATPGGDGRRMAAVSETASSSCSSSSATMDVKGGDAGGDYAMGGHSPATHSQAAAEFGAREDSFPYGLPSGTCAAAPGWRSALSSGTSTPSRACLLLALPRRWRCACDPACVTREATELSRHRMHWQLPSYRPQRGHTDYRTSILPTGVNRANEASGSQSNLPETQGTAGLHTTSVRL